jgi:hypothetical protein
LQHCIHLSISKLAQTPVMDEKWPSKKSANSSSGANERILAGACYQDEKTLCVMRALAPPPNGLRCQEIFRMVRSSNNFMVGAIFNFYVAIQNLGQHFRNLSSIVNVMALIGRIKCV